MHVGLAGGCYANVNGGWVSRFMDMIHFSSFAFVDASYFLPLEEV